MKGPLDRIAAFAAREFEVPISLVCLVSQGRQQFLSFVGMEALRETQNDIAFCAHAVTMTSPLVVPDALDDPRFAADPMVVGEHGIRFFASALLRPAGGQVMGMLCIMDRRPRRFDRVDRAILGGMGDQVVEALLRHERDVEGPLRLPRPPQSGPHRKADRHQAT